LVWGFFDWTTKKHPMDRHAYGVTGFPFMSSSRRGIIIRDRYISLAPIFSHCERRRLLCLYRAFFLELSDQIFLHGIVFYLVLLPVAKRAASCLIFNAGLSVVVGC
jgi:hypothetical protein